MLLWMILVASSICNGNTLSSDEWFYITVICYVWNAVITMLEYKRRDI